MRFRGSFDCEPKILDDFADDTAKFWQPHMRRQVSREDARQIAENVSGFFRVLLDWDAAEQPQLGQANVPRIAVAGIDAGPLQSTGEKLPKARSSSKLVENRRASALEERK